MKWPEPVRRGALSLSYRLGGWPRRLVAGLCLVLAGWSAFRDHRDPASGTVGVVIATHDLGAGSLIAGGDVRVARWPIAQVPRTAVRSAGQAVGASVAAAMDAGEPVTRARLRGPGVTTGLPTGWVAITVAVDNAPAPDLIRAGDHVDVLAAVPRDVVGSETVRARLVASDVRVLLVLPADDRAATTQTTALVLGADRDVALDLASVSATPLTVTLRGP